MSTKELDRILDDCVDRLAAGSTVADCLAAYPNHAPRLNPLLNAAARSLNAAHCMPSSEAMQCARLRLNRAIARHDADCSVRSRPTFLDRLVARPLTLAAVSSIGVIALTVLLVAFPLGDGDVEIPPSEPVGPVTEPATPAPTTSPTTATPTTPPTDSTPTPQTIVTVPDPEGNFAFYLSDAPNDIGDFASLMVTIDSIDLKPRGAASWVRITGIETTADLVQLQGDLAVELWRGDIPDGDYATVFLNIAEIEGTLIDSEAAVEVVLPSERLHVNSDFTVASGDATGFVFDLTVHRAGQSGGILRYVLSPQSSESGAGRSVRVVRGDSPPGNAPDSATNGSHDTAGNDEQPQYGAPQPSPMPGPADDRDNATHPKVAIRYALETQST